MPEATSAARWDSHIHILPPRRIKGLVRWIKRTLPDHCSREDMTVDDILADLRAVGVVRAFNFVFPLSGEETAELNRFNYDLCKTHLELVPFGSLHLEDDRKDEIAERCIAEYGFAGIKLHPYVQRFEAFSQEFEPLYRKLDELGRPFLVHTGFDVFYRQTQDLDYLRGLLERYSRMPVVLVHSLYPRFALARELLEQHPQLYLDMTNVISAMRWHLDAPADADWSSGAEYELVTKNLDDFYALFELHHDRIMFGTDHPAGMGSPEQIYRDLASFSFRDDVIEDLTRGTAQRFLREHCGME